MLKSVSSSAFSWQETDDIQPEVVTLEHVIHNILARSSENIHLLSLGNSLNRVSKSELTGRFHLNKDNRAFVACNDVDFLMSGAVVPLEDFVAVVLKIVCRKVLDVPSEFPAIIFQGEEPPVVLPPEADGMTCGESCMARACGSPGGVLGSDIPCSA